MERDGSILISLNPGMRLNEKPNSLTTTTKIEDRSGDFEIQSHTDKM